MLKTTLLWAIRRHGLSHHIREALVWNQPSGVQDSLVSDCLRSDHDLLTELRARFPEALIIHWLGVHKLSAQLRGQIENLMFNGPLTLKRPDPIS